MASPRSSTQETQDSSHKIVTVFNQVKQHFFFRSRNIFSGLVPEETSGSGNNTTPITSRNQTTQTAEQLPSSDPAEQLSFSDPQKEFPLNNKNLATTTPAHQITYPGQLEASFTTGSDSDNKRSEVSDRARGPTSTSSSRSVTPVPTESDAGVKCLSSDREEKTLLVAASRKSTHVHTFSVDSTDDNSSDEIDEPEYTDTSENRVTAERSRPFNRLSLHQESQPRRRYFYRQYNSTSTSVRASTDSSMPFASRNKPKIKSQPKKIKVDLAAAKAMYDYLQKSSIEFIQQYAAYAEDSNYLMTLTDELCEESDQGEIKHWDFKALNAIARTLFKRDEYNRKVAYPTFCLIQVIAAPEEINVLSKLYFGKAMHGAVDSNPVKWSPLKRIIIIAIAVFFTALVLGALFSFGYAIAIKGLSATLSSPLLSIWDLFPGKPLIPLFSSGFNQLLVHHFFGKSLIQKKIDEYERPLEPLEKKAYPNDQASLRLLQASIKEMTDENLRENLSSLCEVLLQEVGEANQDRNNIQVNQLNYLRPILFATTAFARNLIYAQNHPQEDTDELIKLSFYAVKGAGFAEPPNQSTWKQWFSRALPALVVLTLAVGFAFFCLTSFHALVILSTVASVLTECCSAVPKDMLSPEHLRRTNSIFKNSITRSILETEKTLTKRVEKSSQPSPSHKEINRRLSQSTPSTSGSSRSLNSSKNSFSDSFSESSSSLVVSQPRRPLSPHSRKDHSAVTKHRKRQRGKKRHRFTNK